MKIEIQGVLYDIIKLMAEVKGKKRTRTLTMLAVMFHF